MNGIGEPLTVVSNTVRPYRVVLRRHEFGFSETELKWEKGRGWVTLSHREWRTGCTK